MPDLICPKCHNRGAPGEAFTVGPQTLHERLRDKIENMLEVEVELETDADETERLAIRGKRHITQRDTVREADRTLETE